MRPYLIHTPPLLLWLRVLVIAALVGAGAPDAAACPSPYNGLTCAGGGTSDVCQTVGNTWYCEGDRGGAATLDAEMYAVYEPAGTWCTADSYCAFGTDGYGVDFCCEIDPTTPSTTIIAVVLDGTDTTGGTGDLLDFEFSTGGVSRFLRDAAGVVLTGIQYGGAGDDTMWGSNSTSADYDESLYGEDDDDGIHGRDGGDFIVGGDGDDACFGDNGVDYITAGNGDDTVYGGAQADDLEGNNGADRLHGGSHADDLYGEQVGDTYCSGNDPAFDRLRESAVASDDLLWGDAADFEQGNLDGSFTGDGCALLGTSDLSCEYQLTTAPTFCL